MCVQCRATVCVCSVELLCEGVCVQCRANV